MIKKIQAVLVITVVAALFDDENDAVSSCCARPTECMNDLITARALM